jgi:2-polyprenyl-3-methyl-5-hydroxy-6-metoxy-1,4-benzoquinol methylase
MVHHNICPVCSSDKTGLLYRCTDHFISKEDFKIFKCSGCNFEFTQDSPEETEIGHYYESEEYISHSDISKGISNKLYRLARRVMLHKKKNIIRNVTGLNTGRILDIGSGTGHFASEMKKAGWLVKGIEINEKARDFSFTHFGLEVIEPGQISTLKTNSFDCISLWHVLEHFHDPLKYSSDILRLLKPGGICVIALPNCCSFDAKHYGRFWAAYDVPRHLWHFNPSTFSLFSKKTGLKLEILRTLPLDVFYISILSEKYKGSGLFFLKGITMALLFTFLSFFNKKKCSSVIYILRKPID